VQRGARGGGGGGVLLVQVAGSAAGSTNARGRCLAGALAGTAIALTRKRTLVNWLSYWR
jgi:hypothetical protein